MDIEKEFDPTPNLHFTGNASFARQIEKMKRVLPWIWQFHVVDTAVVNLLCTCTSRTSDAFLVDLCNRGFAQKVHLDRVPTRAFMLTRKGADFTRRLVFDDPNIRIAPAMTEPSALDVPRIRHSLLTQIAALNVAQKMPGSEVVSEHFLKKRKLAPKIIRKRPDACIFSGDKRIAIEAQESYEKAHRQETILSNYAYLTSESMSAKGRYEAVYFASTQPSILDRYRNVGIEFPGCRYDEYDKRWIRTGTTEFYPFAPWSILTLDLAKYRARYYYDGCKRQQK